MTDKVFLEFSCGALLRRHIRTQLDKAKIILSGEIDYKEYKGFLDSNFLISGSAKNVKKIENWLDNIMKDQKND